MRILVICEVDDFDRVQSNCVHLAGEHPCIWSYTRRELTWPGGVIRVRRETEDLEPGFLATKVVVPRNSQRYRLCNALHKSLRQDDIMAANAGITSF